MDDEHAPCEGVAPLHIWKPSVLRMRQQPAHYGFFLAFSVTVLKKS